jgi:hypothetical protein
MWDEDASPVAGVSGVGDDDRLRGAVASFNEKMLEKYGGDDENIPSTPKSPAYSSIFEGGAQRGGSGGRSRYIPQIPNGVLESYLSSRDSKGGAPVMRPHVGGSSAGGSNIGAMMMNVPVVATMPMAGMMPIQAQQGGSNGVGVGAVGGGVGAVGGGVGAGAGVGGASLQTQQPTQAGGGTIIPNSEGVKTFSIKM